MLRSLALVFVSTFSLACGDGAGTSPEVVCPNVSPGEDEISQPSDRDRIDELCGPECYPFYGQVFRESDECLDPDAILVGGMGLCLPLWTDDCRANGLRLELLGCAPNQTLDSGSAFNDAVTCHAFEDGTLATVGITGLFPLDEERWSECTVAQQEQVFCTPL